MEIISAKVLPLPCKHYSTDVDVTVVVEDTDFHFTISVSGFGPNASSREKERGWEPDWGMDHTESEAHLFLAKRIVEALTGGKDERL